MKRNRIKRLPVVIRDSHRTEASLDSRAPIATTHAQAAMSPKARFSRKGIEIRYRDLPATDQNAFPPPYPPKYSTKSMDRIDSDYDRNVDERTHAKYSEASRHRGIIPESCRTRILKRFNCIKRNLASYGRARKEVRGHKDHVNASAPRPFDLTEEELGTLCVLKRFITY